MAYDLFDDLGRPKWQKEGACNGDSVNVDMFFPERGSSTREAKSICAMCPVQGECLDYALMNGEKFGIWGGTSERERRRIRKFRTLQNKDWRQDLRDFYGLKEHSNRDN